MTTLTIELSDDQAAVLKAKATSYCLSLEDWIKRLAVTHSRYKVTEPVEKCDLQAQLSPEDREWLGSPSI